MLKVGITGGIGSGKTTVCKVFELLGVPLYYSDAEARIIIDTNPDVKKAITDVFGIKSYQNGALNRPYISSLVFEDEAKLKTLNAITHPAVAAHFNNWIKSKDVPYVVKEAAILFESGAYKTVDKVITVTAPLNVRLQRVVARDGLSEKEILARVANQMPEEEKVARADEVIYADDVQLVIPQVLEIDKKLRI